MNPLLLATASLILIAMAAQSFAAGTHPVRRGEVAADPQTTASITQGPDMITRAGSSQKRARADLDAKNPALTQTVTAKRWQEIKDR